MRLTYTAKIKYDNREAEGIIKACTSRHHIVLFGVWWANITTIEGKKNRLHIVALKLEPWRNSSCARVWR